MPYGVRPVAVTIQWHMSFRLTFEGGIVVATGCIMGSKIRCNKRSGGCKQASSETNVTKGATDVSKLIAESIIQPVATEARVHKGGRTNCVHRPRTTRMTILIMIV